MNSHIYQDNLVSIDSEVVRIGATQYDLDGIVSYTGLHKPKQTCLARAICILLFIVGGLFILGIIITYIDTFYIDGIDRSSTKGKETLSLININSIVSMVFIVPASLILMWIRSQKDTYAIQFQTSAGTVEAVSSYHENYIDQLLHALGEAKRQSKALRR